MLWGGKGVVRPDRSGVEDSVYDELLRRHRKAVAGVRKYIVRNTSDVTIFIDRANVCLNKHMNIARLDADDFFDKTTQQAVLEGKIELADVVESYLDDDGNEGWKSVGKEVTQEMDFNSVESICCFWEGPIFDAGGYANMNRQYVFNLSDLGARVKPALTATLMDVEDEVKSRIMKLSEVMIPLISPKVFATNVPMTHVGRSISYTMMETEGTVHELLAQKLLQRYCPRVGSI